MLTIGLLVGALVAGGCGSDDDEPQNAAQQQPEGAVDGTGYSLVPPDGWRDATKLFEGSAIGIDLAYAEPEQHDGFANNVNVIRETPTGLDADRFDDYVKQFRDQASAQATDEGLSPTDKTELDGEPARAWDYEARRPERPRIRQRQIVAIHGDALYTLTWSVRRDVSEERATALESLLDSWRWSGR